MAEGACLQNNCALLSSYGQWVNTDTQTPDRKRMWEQRGKLLPWGWGFISSTTHRWWSYVRVWQRRRGRCGTFQWSPRTELFPELPPEKETKEQLWMKGPRDTSQKHNPGQNKEHWENRQQKPGLPHESWHFHFSSLSDRDGSREATHPSLSSREAGSKWVRRLRDPILWRRQMRKNCQRPLGLKTFLYKQLFGAPTIRKMIRSTKGCWGGQCRG